MSASSSGREHEVDLTAGSSEEPVDQRWVLGPAATSPDESLSTVDRRVPPEVSTVDLARYCLMLGDDALVLSQRMSRWVHRSPELEEDTALARIVVDLLEQARILLRRSGEVEGRGRDEDMLAHTRSPEAFGNVRLVELDCGPRAGGGFEASIAQLLVCATWRAALFRGLGNSRDPVLAALSENSKRELAWHAHHAGLWVIRLAESEAEPRRRMIAGLRRVWPMTAELFAPHPVELRLAQEGVAVDPATVRTEVRESLDEVLSMARLDTPEVRGLDDAGHPAGRDGVHTESLEFLLADMRAEATSVFER